METVDSGDDALRGTSATASAGPNGQSSGRVPSPTSSASMRRTALRLLILQEFAPTAALVVVVLLVGLTHPLFFGATALQGNIEVAALTGITAIGMVFLLAMGEIDISVGGIYGTCFILCAQLGVHGINMYVAATIAVAAGVVLGLANGVMMLVFRAPAIIVTLGTYSLYAGVVNVLADGNQVGQGLPLSSSFFTFVGGNLLGVPVAGWFAVGICIVLTIIFTRSRLGVMVRASGSNRSAAGFSGIPVDRLRVYGLMLTGGLAGLAGVLDLSYVQGGDSTSGTGYELQAIAAAIIGGTAITGGTGSVPGGLIGAMLVATINGGLVFFNVNPLWDDVVTGAVILAAVGSTSLLASRRAGRMTRLEA